ncbi:MAG: hypothetical protein ACI4QR_00580, partial [Eubacteriales bacterium]
STSHEKDSEGRTIIDLRVINDDDFLSPYSTENHNVISEEVSDFIERSLNSVPYEEPIHFRIHSDSITEDEQKEYTDAIHRHFADCYENTRFEKKKLHRVAFIMTFIAVVALSFMIGFEVSNIKSAVVSEIIDIFAWVFMWEAVDIFFLQCTMLRFKQHRYLLLADSVIEYLPLNEAAI